MRSVKRSRVLVALLLALIMFAAGCSPADEPAAAECPVVTVLTNDTDNERSAFYAIEQGIITSDIVGEVDVEYTTIPGLIAAVGTGQYDVTLTSVPGVVFGREGGLDLRVLGISLSHTGGGFKAFVPADSDLQSPADLAGKTFGVTAFGSTGTLADRILLSEKYGLDVDFEDGDMTWVELDPPTLMASLLRGDVDAATLFHNHGWEALNNPDVRILMDSDNEYRELTGEWNVGAAFVVEADQLEDNHDCVVEFRRMLLESVAYVEDNLDEVAEAVAPVSGVPADFIRYWWDGNHEYGGGIDDEWLDRAQTIMDLGHEIGVMPPAPNFREIIIED